MEYLNFREVMFRGLTEKIAISFKDLYRVAKRTKRIRAAITPTQTGLNVARRLKGSNISAITIGQTRGALASRTTKKIPRFIKKRILAGKFVSPSMQKKFVGHKGAIDSIVAPNLPKTKHLKPGSIGISGDLSKIKMENLPGGKAERVLRQGTKKTKRAINDVTRMHEGFEADAVRKSYKKKNVTTHTDKNSIGGHLSPEVLIGEHNVVRTLKGSDGKQTSDFFKKIREKERTKDLLEKAVPGFKLHEGKRVSRHAKKRIAESYVRNREKATKAVSNRIDIESSASNSLGELRPKYKLNNRQRFSSKTTKKLKRAAESSQEASGDKRMVAGSLARRKKRQRMKNKRDMASYDVDNAFKE